MAMRFDAPDYVVLVVATLDPAIAFYTETLGLALKHRSGPFAQLDTGRTQLALYEREAMAKTLGYAIEAPARETPGFELGFKVDDVDATWHALMAANVPAVTPPADRPWGQRTAYVADPDGHLIELAQPLG